MKEKRHNADVVDRPPHIIEAAHSLSLNHVLLLILSRPPAVHLRLAWKMATATASHALSRSTSAGRRHAWQKSVPGQRKTFGAGVFLARPQQHGDRVDHRLLEISRRALPEMGRVSPFHCARLAIFTQLSVSRANPTLYGEFQLPMGGW